MEERQGNCVAMRLALIFSLLYSTVLEKPLAAIKLARIFCHLSMTVSKMLLAAIPL